MKYNWEQASHGRVRKLKPQGFRLLALPVFVSTSFSLTFLIRFFFVLFSIFFFKFLSVLAVFRETKGGEFFLSLHKNACE